MCFETFFFTASPISPVCMYIQLRVSLGVTEICIKHNKALTSIGKNQSSRTSEQLDVFNDTSMNCR